MDYLKNIFENRIAIAVIFIIALVLVIYFLFVKKPKGQRSNKNTLKTVSDTIPELESRVQPSYSDVQYSSYADSLYNSMRYSLVADNYSEAERILKTLLNDLDVMKVIEAYGTRIERYFGIPVDGAKTLPEQVRNDLSTARIDRINSDYQSKGIKFRF